uniref:Uncharacterized protein n=1 Tax=Cacopsylla melanoneura TaxID=428564 RepID=A0A8D8X1Q3_9HEMI
MLRDSVMYINFINLFTSHYLLQYPEPSICSTHAVINISGECVYHLRILYEANFLTKDTFFKVCFTIKIMKWCGQKYGLLRLWFLFVWFINSSNTPSNYPL